MLNVYVGKIPNITKLSGVIAGLTRNLSPMQAIILSLPKGLLPQPCRTPEMCALL